MVLLVVDTQNLIMTEALYKFKTFTQNVEKLILTARQQNIEVIYVRHNDDTELIAGTAGFEIYDKFAPLDNEKIFDKHFNSAFRGTGLCEYLTKKHETEIMVAGLQSDFCIDATIKCGFEHGFKMIVPEFCNTTVENEFMTGEQSYDYYNKMMWNKRYANCVSFQKALSMLKSK